MMLAATRTRRGLPGRDPMDCVTLYRFRLRISSQPVVDVEAHRAVSACTESKPGIYWKWRVRVRHC